MLYLFYKNSNKKSRISIRLIFLYTIFMTNKHFIQNKLKDIFSNKNIVLNSLNFCKKNYLNHKHLQYIISSISKFLACRDLSKGFVSFKCPNCLLLTNSLFPVNPDYVLLAVTNILNFGLIIFIIIFLTFLTDMFFLLFLKFAECFSSMIEIYFLSFLSLLMISLNFSSIIFLKRIKELIKFPNLLNITSLILIFFIMVLFLLFILSGVI